MTADNLRRIQTGEVNVGKELIKKCIDRFFFELLIYCYDFNTREDITIDGSYLPYHLLDENLIKITIDYLENQLGYMIIVQKISNPEIYGYKKGDSIQIKIYNKEQNAKTLDQIFSMNSIRTIYSTFHKYSEVHNEFLPESKVNKNEYRLDTQILALN